MKYSEIILEYEFQSPKTKCPVYRNPGKTTIIGLLNKSKFKTLRILGLNDTFWAWDAAYEAHIHIQNYLELLDYRFRAKSSWKFCIFLDPISNQLKVFDDDAESQVGKEWLKSGRLHTYFPDAEMVPSDEWWKTVFKPNKKFDQMPS